MKISFVPFVPFCGLQIEFVYQPVQVGAADAEFFRGGDLAAL
jgi:hypothetical protein